MIKKYLIIGKRIDMVSTLADEELSGLRTIEILMPLEVYWELNKKLEEADIIMTGTNKKNELLKQYKEVFKLASPYAASETERTWLYEQYEEE